MSLLTNCNPDDLRSALSGSLGRQKQQVLETHLESCNQCRIELEKIAAEDVDWEKVSDFFAQDLLQTEPYAGQQTIDIQLSRGDHGSGFAFQEPDQFSPDAPDTLQPASHPEMLGRIDGFEVEEIIGRGGMGVVYKGFDSELNRPIAIKVLVDHLAANGVARQRFAREARAAAAVMHPNVVPIHSVNSEAKQPYLVMSLVSGRSLQAHVETEGQLDVREIVRIAKQIASGLAAAHREGLVHRDIKPANILLEKDVSRVMITDFGLARAADDAAITQTGWLAGTPHYMSPEQASGKEVDHRSDLFSLGSVIYFMATGREPFRAEIPVAVLQKIANEVPNNIRTVNSNISKTMQRVVERLMSKRLEDRFQSAEEVESVLTKYLAHLEQPATQPKPKVRKVRQRHEFSWANWLAFASVGLLLCILMAIVWNSDISRNSRNVDPGGGSQLVEFQWPEGLQSPDSWQRDFMELEEDLRKLENTGLENSFLNRSRETASGEAAELEMSIQQLERLLGN